MTGGKLPLLVGTVIASIAFLFLALVHEPWEIYVGSTLMGTGTGLAFAAIANLIVEAVPPEQTGVASGMNTIVRTIAGAIGAEIGATLLAANMLTSGYPDEHGYTLTFLVASAGGALAAVATMAVPGRRRAAPRPATPFPRSAPG
jgi:MFS family permease